MNSLKEWMSVLEALLPPAKGPFVRPDEEEIGLLFTQIADWAEERGLTWSSGLRVMSRNKKTPCLSHLRPGQVFWHGEKESSPEWAYLPDVLFDRIKGGDRENRTALIYYRTIEEALIAAAEVYQLYEN